MPPRVSGLFMSAPSMTCARGALGAVPGRRDRPVPHRLQRNGAFRLQQQPVRSATASLTRAQGPDQREKGSSALATPLTVRCGA
jgi:hypothetical protein